MLYPEGKLKVTKGIKHVKVVNKYGYTERNFCKLCGSFVWANAMAFKLQTIPAPRLVDFKYEPAFHVQYRYRSMNIKDGLTKYSDFPASFGGSDLKLDE